MCVIFVLFFVGLVIFVLFYCVQLILLVLLNEFGVLLVSSSILFLIFMVMLVVGLLFIGLLLDVIGCKLVMVIVLLLVVCCLLLLIMMISWYGILIMCVFIGLLLSGVVVVGMIYLSEEIYFSFVVFLMGFYISGNFIGGMSGCLLIGVFIDFFGWCVVLVVISGFVLVVVIMFWCILFELCYFCLILL